jgi:hypothetical protein
VKRAQTFLKATKNQKSTYFSTIHYAYVLLGHKHVSQIPILISEKSSDLSESNEESETAQILTNTAGIGSIILTTDSHCKSILLGTDILQRFSQIQIPICEKSLTETKTESAEQYFNILSILLHQDYNEDESHQHQPGRSHRHCPQH